MKGELSPRCPTRCWRNRSTSRGCSMRSRRPPACWSRSGPEFGAPELEVAERAGRAAGRALDGAEQAADLVKQAVDLAVREVLRVAAGEQATGVGVAGALLLHPTDIAVGVVPDGMDADRVDQDGRDVGRAPAVKRGDHGRAALGDLEADGEVRAIGAAP